MKALIVDLLTSKKFVTAVLFALFIGIAHAIGQHDMALEILGLGMTAVLGFGLADLGKAGKALEAEATVQAASIYPQPPE